MVKIVIFHCGFIYSGGGERIVLEEALGLKKKGYQVLVYGPTLDPKKCYPDLVSSVGVKTFLPIFIDKLPYKNALRMIVTSLLAPLFSLRFKDADLFIGANQPGAWLAYSISKVLKKPYIAYLNQPNRLLYPRPVDREYGWYHTVSDYEVLDILINLFKPIISYLDKASITKSDRLLVNGAYIKDIIENIYATKSIDCPAGAYVFPHEKIDRFRGSVVINGKKINKPYLLITNRHDPQKRFDFVIKALSLLKKDFPRLKLVIPGPFTKHTKKLLKQVKDLNLERDVIFNGQISETDLQKLYQNCAVYCYPAPYEDFGLGPLESGGWSIPTVAWNHGGPTVTVIDGKTGFLAKPYDVSDYASKIKKLISDQKLCIRLGEVSYRKTKELFSWERHVDIIEKNIKELLNKPSS